MPECKKCGSMIEDDEGGCSKCGTRITDSVINKSNISNQNQNVQQVVNVITASDGPQADQKFIQQIDLGLELHAIFEQIFSIQESYELCCLVRSGRSGYGFQFYEHENKLGRDLHYKAWFSPKRHHSLVGLHCESGDNALNEKMLVFFGEDVVANIRKQLGDRISINPYEPDWLEGVRWTHMTMIKQYNALNIDSVGDTIRRLNRFIDVVHPYTIDLKKDLLSITS